MNNNPLFTNSIGITKKIRGNRMDLLIIIIIIMIFASQSGELGEKIKRKKAVQGGCGQTPTIVMCVRSREKKKLETLLQKEFLI